LNILPRDLQKLDSLDDYTMAVKPLLLLGDCNQEWIKNNASSINDRIKKIAIGAYYFHDTFGSCDLIEKKQDGNCYRF
jgi:hypothetical protein